jgi:hypothetical protein
MTPAATSSQPDRDTAPDTAPSAFFGLTQNASLQLWLFAITLFSSALLLFAVQPMFAKMALPKLGGSPSVWAVSMCFFQTALLAGYCYAHALNRFLPPRLAVLVHVSLLVVTLLALPIGLPASLGEPPQGDAYLWLTSVLTLGVGLPFFAVSANAPLLQAWFARTGHPSARDPYFLYGASNIGSLLALLAYPLAIEPLLGAVAQSRVWSFGFMLLAVLITLCGLLTIALSDKSIGAASSSEETAAAAITGSQRALWVLLAALPSGLMVAVTTFVTTDVASAPFLWVLPLAMFLGTFIVVFKDKLSPRFALISAILPFTVMAGLVAPHSVMRMVLALSSFFMVALVCHRELYLRRPDARHLTEFYLWMSAGGVIGGVFAALIAPQVFTSTFEFTLLMAAGLLCLPGLIFQSPDKLDAKRIAGLTCFALAALVGQSIAGDVLGLRGQHLALFGLIIGIILTAYFTRSWPEQRIAVVLGLATISIAMPEQFRPLYAERSFFGTVRVAETGDGLHRMMFHGTTLHGVRRIKTDDGKVLETPTPGSYYHAATPMARGFDVARKAKTSIGGDTNDTRILAGIVGLGTGSLACYAKPGDAFRFYEIDPVVVKVATNPKHFDYLLKCAPKAPIIVGDARLTLAKEQDEVFDYLVIDAFSSDSVPVHLLTVEALKLYLAKTSETGLLALHISNRFMDLPTAVSATLAEIPGVHAAFARFDPKPEDADDANSSHVVLISRSSKVLDDVLTWTDAEGLPRTTVKPWTDDFSNVITAIARRMGH